MKVALQELAELEALEVKPMNDDVRDVMARLPDLAQAAITRYIAQDPIPLDWPILATELEMGEEKARLDLGVRDSLGPAVIDFKTKRKLEARYKAKTLEEFRYSPQQLHYLWRWAQQLGEPVLRYYIVLVVLGPRFEASLNQYDVPAKTLKFWAYSYEHHWDRMDVDSMEPDQYPAPANFNSCHTRFGACEFQAACHDYHHDPQLMLMEYVQKGIKR